jgi:hypothetical protein
VFEENEYILIASGLGKGWGEGWIEAGTKYG